MKNRFKTGDIVKILSGTSRGKQGKVLKIDRKKDMALVEGINMQSHYTRKSEKDPKGGIVKREGMLQMSKLQRVEGGEATPAKASKEKASTKTKTAKK